MSVKIDYKSIPRSYRDYLDLMVSKGEYLAIDDEIDWNLEMGAICRHADETLSPSPIFNKVKDSPGFRAVHADGNPGSLPAFDRKQPGAPADHCREQGCTL